MPYMRLRLDAFGSDPLNPEGDTTNYYTNTLSYFSGFNGILLEDSLNNLDYRTMKPKWIAGLADVEYWYSGRLINEDNGVGYITFGCRRIRKIADRAETEIPTDSFTLILSGGAIDSISVRGYGFRPVITMKPSLGVVDTGEELNGKAVWDLEI